MTLECKITLVYTLRKKNCNFYSCFQEYVWHFGEWFKTSKFWRNWQWEHFWPKIIRSRSFLLIFSLGLLQWNAFVDGTSHQSIRRLTEFVQSYIFFLCVIKDNLTLNHEPIKIVNNYISGVNDFFFVFT